METAPYFSSVHDPRVVGRCKHKLSDILMVALITYLCGGEDYSDMYQLCRFRGKEFKPLLELPNDCPSGDTFERVMQAVHPQGNRIKIIHSFILLNITLTTNGNSTLFLFHPRPTCCWALQAQTQ